MPNFKITVKNSRVCRGQRVDKGMVVYVHTNQFSNPIISDKDAVRRAFKMRGVDIDAVGALSQIYLEAKRIG